MKGGSTGGGVLQVLRWLILAVLFIYLLLPLVMLGNLTGLSQAVYDHLARNLISDWRDPGPVATFADPGTLAELETRLAALSAYVGEAEGAAKTLQVLLVQFKPEPPPTSASKPSTAAKPTRSGFHTLDLDLSTGRRNAVLVISPAPLILHLQNSNQRPRARLALESPAPIEIEGGYAGLLAGYRIGAFGDWQTTRPADLIEGQDPQAFCRSLRIWRRHFGLARKDVWITAIAGAKRIAVTDLDVVHDGREQIDLPKLNLFCTSW